MARGATDLLGIDAELDDALLDFAFLADYYRDSHPANAGDVSMLLSNSIAQRILDKFLDSASGWFPLSKLGLLATIRDDGRTGYRAQGIRQPLFYEHIHAIAGRSLLITRTGSQIPSLQSSISRYKDGELLTVIQVNEAADCIRVVFGNSQYGSIPSIETHVHLLGNSIMLSQGARSSAVVHAHPPHLVLLGRHPRIQGDFERFNAALYTQVEGILRNYEGLVGIVPYAQSGTEDLLVQTIEPFVKYQLLLWMNHGFIVRESSIRRAYTLLAYAEDAARSAIETFSTDGLGLPFEAVRSFLTQNSLLDAYTKLFADGSKS